MLEEARWIRMDFQYSRVVNGNLQQYTLIDIWKDEIIDSFKFVKGDIEFLEYVNRLKYITSEIDKFKKIKIINGKMVGGHLDELLFDTNQEIYAILDSGVIPYVKNYSTRTYKQVRRSSLYMYKNGLPPKRKQGWHTWIENITQDEFLQEIAYALSKKGNGIPDVGYPNRIKYYSSFSDGCKVTLIIERNVTINGTLYTNYITALILNP